MLRVSRILSCKKIPKLNESEINRMFVLDFFSWILPMLSSDVPLTLQRMLMSVFPYLITLSVTWIDIVAYARIEKK